MKTLKLLFAFLLITIISCSKDDNQKQKYQEEDPLPAFLSKVNFRQSTPKLLDNDEYMERGLVFTPYTKGTFNAFILKLPVSEGFTKVSLWDAETKIIIASDEINVDVADTEIIKRISPVTLEKGKKYLVSVKSKNGYLHNDIGSNNGVIQFPVTISNNLVINSHLWKGDLNYSDNAVYPDSGANALYYGNVSFLFQQID
jgi:hypothetical protein